MSRFELYKLTIDYLLQPFDIFTYNKELIQPFGGYFLDAQNLPIDHVLKNPQCIE
jgi:hypothetical protein